MCKSHGLFPLKGKQDCLSLQWNNVTDYLKKMGNLAQSYKIGKVNGLFLQMWKIHILRKAAKDKNTGKRAIEMVDLSCDSNPGVVKLDEFSGNRKKKICLFLFLLPYDGNSKTSCSGGNTREKRQQNSLNSLNALSTLIF